MKQQFQKIQNAAADVAIYDENVPNYLKLTQKVASTRNLRSNNKGILINANQHSKTFEKETGDTVFSFQRHYQFSKPRISI